MSGRAKDLIVRNGLDKVTNHWLTLSEIGDNNIFLGYESSLSVIRPVTSVTVGDLCISDNFVGVVTEVYTGSLENDLGLKGVKVKYSDVYNQVKGSDVKHYYTEKVFVFGKEKLPNGIHADTSNVNVVDMSSIKIVKLNTETYKDKITEIIDLRNKRIADSVAPAEGPGDGDA